MSDAPTRLLIVEDHAMVATALAAALEAASDITVTAILGSVGDLDDLTPTPDGLRIADVALVDYYLTDGTGIDAATLLAEHSPLTRVVVMSARSSPEQLREALEVGCVAFVDKSSRLEDLLRAVRAAARGEASFDAVALQAALRAASAEPERSSDTTLSDRERQVLGMLAAGLATEVIATQLYLSPHTVRNHVRNLTAKLGAHSRLEAVSIAARAGLVTLLAPHE